MSETWKTPKGTTLYLINLKGKPYLPVAERLIWFREEKANWRIHTEFVKLDNDFTIAKALILDEQGNVIATAHKREDRQHFQDHMEKAEAGAIGRALAYCGFGTQFCADELNEDERIVDAPAARPAKPAEKPVAKPAAQPQAKMQTAGDYVIPFGQNKGKKLSDMTTQAISNLMGFVKNKADQKFRDSQNAKEFLFWAEAYLKKNPVSELDQALDAPPDFMNEPFPEWNEK